MCGCPSIFYLLNQFRSVEELFRNVENVGGIILCSKDIRYINIDCNIICSGLGIFQNTISMDWHLYCCNQYANLNGKSRIWQGITGCQQYNRCNRIYVYNLLDVKSTTYLKEEKQFGVFGILIKNRRLLNLWFSIFSSILTPHTIWINRIWMKFPPTRVFTKF